MRAVGRVVADAALSVLSLLRLVDGLSVTGGGVTVVRSVLDTADARAGAGQIDVLAVAVLTGIRVENKDDGWMGRGVAVTIVADQNAGDSAGVYSGLLGDGRDVCGCDSLNISDGRKVGNSLKVGQCGSRQSDNSTILGNGGARLSDDGARKSDGISRFSDSGTGQGNCVAVRIGCNHAVDSNVNGEQDVGASLTLSKTTATVGSGLSTTAMDIIGRARDITLVFVFAVAIIENSTTPAATKESQYTDSVH